MIAYPGVLGILSLFFAALFIVAAIWKKACPPPPPKGGVKNRHNPSTTMSFSAFRGERAVKKDQGERVTAQNPQRRIA
jgi:hypothetical protein